MMNNSFFDLYLFTITESDKLVKIPHLTMDDATKYSRQWLKLNDFHDYMLVTEGSTPWSEPVPDITIESTEWIEAEYKKIIR